MKGRHQIDYGWWLMLGAALGTALIAGLFFWSFGLYIDPLQRQFGWSRSEVSLGISVALLASGVASPLVGRWTNRFGPRLILLIGTALCTGGLALLATVGSLWQWYLYLAVVGVSLSMIFVIPFQVLAARWFERRRSVAVGLLGMGGSIGGLVLVPVLRFVIDALGWEGAFLLSAALVGVYYLPFTILVVRGSPHGTRALRGEAPSRSTMLVSPAVAGAIFDATGSYDAALVMFMGAFLASLALFYVALRLPRPTIAVPHMVREPEPLPAGSAPGPGSAGSSTD